jgi:hypothetical protein
MGDLFKRRSYSAAADWTLYLEPYTFFIILHPRSIFSLCAYVPMSVCAWFPDTSCTIDPIRNPKFKSHFLDKILPTIQFLHILI